MPIIQADYDLLEDDLTLLIVKDKQSGAVLAYDCETKGPGDTWIVKQLTKDLAASNDGTSASRGAGQTSPADGAAKLASV